MNTDPQLPKGQEMAEDDVQKIHERLDRLVSSLNVIKVNVATLTEHCGPCSTMVKSHEVTLRGNGKTGLVTEVAKLADGKGDTLSVSSVCKLVAAFAALSATIIGAVLLR